MLLSKGFTKGSVNGPLTRGYQQTESAWNVKVACCIVSATRSVYAPYPAGWYVANGRYCPPPSQTIFFHGEATGWERWRGIRPIGMHVSWPLGLELRAGTNISTWAYKTWHFQFRIDPKRILKFLSGNAESHHATFMWVVNCWVGKVEAWMSAPETWGVVAVGPDDGAIGMWRASPDGETRQRLMEGQGGRTQQPTGRRGRCQHVRPLGPGEANVRALTILHAFTVIWGFRDIRTSSRF